jgi:hypothetical protein
MVRVEIKRERDGEIFEEGILIIWHNSNRNNFLHHHFLIL